MKTKKIYASLDLHAERTVLGVMNESGRMVSVKRFATSREGFERHVGALERSGVALTMEMGPMTRWAARICRPLVDELVVCNPRHNRLISRHANKNDERDVESLCELLRIEALSPIWIGEDPGRELYRSLVWDMLSWRNKARYLKTQIKSKYRTFGLGECRGQKIYTPKGRGQYLEMINDPIQRRMLQRLYDQYDLAQAHWKMTLKEVKTHSRNYPEVRRLQQLPGIAEVGANVFCAIVEDPQRFKSPKQLWRFCRLGVTSRSSDGKPLGYERIDKAGHGELKNVSYTAWRTACFANAGDNPLKRYYHASLERTGVVRHARLNTQRKLLSVMLALWKSGRPYDEEKFFPRECARTEPGSLRTGSHR